ncbi:GNAT family N-acetyltransferase [Paracoccus sp. TK19116]|uniref:GNAT family N-acetyltransferase n=1 Tax=Paracoccus albicereus TaxID=2922394 RepID=A0ABT1MRD1_9RHOB|nr:GNAT family N-acetyltransferase [Paracoccus albicereus]MCQ0970874.1 GNAT family N-acetyltransferase [Paracoccus albicereus]
MSEAALFRAFERTWPAAEYADAGGFSVGRGRGGGGRVSSARKAGNWSPDDIEAAADLQRGWDQEPMFRVLDSDHALTEALEDRGYARTNPTAIMAVSVERLTDRDLPPVTAFTVWPPLAIQREIWSAGNIGPSRQAVMDRVTGPKAALLGRIEDRAAGAGFVAIDSGVAMIHAVEVLLPWRRKGLAAWMMRAAAFWARENGAETLGLAVSRPNVGALALYERLGFVEKAGYAYFRKPEQA